MPYQILPMPSHGITAFKFTGEMSADEGRQAFVEYTSRPDFDPNHWMITDAREVTGVKATFKDVTRGVASLVGRLRLFRTPVRSVILVDGESPFVWSRVVDQVLEKYSPIEVRVTRDPLEAMVLIGCPDLLVDDLFSSPQDGSAVAPDR